MAASTNSSTLSSFQFIVLFSCFAIYCLPCTSTSTGVLNDVLHRNSFADLMRLPTEAVYQFGDSISDTGNLLLSDPLAGCAKFPYGQTLSNKPNGRFSDGLLMIDYFAKFLGLPLIDPYLKKDGDFSHGVNFAVGGATALDISTLANEYNIIPSTNFSLPVQLNWFKTHLNSLRLNEPEKKAKLSKTLFFMGEIGGNEYNYALTMEKSMTNVSKMVPQVIQAIEIAVKEIIHLGATRIAIPGNFPMGCIVVNLLMFKTNDLTMYDELNCLKHLNSFGQFHNDQLQESIRKLQTSYQNVAIVYVDYYAALKEVIQDATILGFDEHEIFKVCCGVGDNEYNLNEDRLCGSDGVRACENPNKRFSWDGLHFTQHAYQEMAKWLVIQQMHKPL